MEAPKKPILSPAGFILVVTLIVYLGGVILGKSFNPFSWDIETRRIAVFFWGFIAVFGVLIMTVDSYVNKK